MSICKNKRDKTYYISYKYKDDLGNYHSYNIYNKDWTYDKGINFMREIELDEIEKDKENKMMTTHKEDTTFEYVVEMFLKDYYDNYKYQTAYNYDKKVHKYFKCFIDSKQSFANTINQRTVEKWAGEINDLDQSVVTRNRIKTIMRSIIQYAFDRDYMSLDQYKKCKLAIKMTRESTVLKEKLKYWTVEEWEKFIKTFSKDDKWRIFFETNYWGALRIGEVLALTWGDVDYTNNLISINKSIDSSGNITAPKNTSSNMTVSLPSSLILDLKKLQEAESGNENDYVFFKRNVSRTTVRRIMGDHIKQANVPFIPVHGLRHSMASRMINEGIDVFVISKHLRHSSTQQTYDTYCHLFPNRNQVVMESLFKGR